MLLDATIIFTFNYPKSYFTFPLEIDLGMVHVIQGIRDLKIWDATTSRTWWLIKDWN